MRETTFLGLVGSDKRLLADLVSSDIVSTVKGDVEFQSRAARFFVEQLPQQQQQPKGWRGWLSSAEQQ